MGFALILAACCLLAACAVWALWPDDNGPSDGPPDFPDRGHGV